MISGEEGAVEGVGSTDNTSIEASFTPSGEESCVGLTDQLTGKEDVQRILDYVESVAKESRKALTLEFSQKHKGIPFNTTPKLLSGSLLTWFGRRDKNLKLTAEKADSPKLGEVRTSFIGESKKARFRLHADAVFAVAGGTPESPSYLKELNVTVDKRAFTN
jgi:hypothetical protein